MFNMSLGTPLLLADTNQGDEGQVVWLAGGELFLKLGYQRCATIDIVGREFRGPTQSSSLHRCGEYLTQDYVVRGIKAHVCGIHVHMLVQIGHAI